MPVMMMMMKLTLSGSSNKIQVSDDEVVYELLQEN
jgi:hypothetical protein